MKRCHTIGLSLSYCGRFTNRSVKLVQKHFVLRKSLREIYLLAQLDRFVNWFVHWFAFTSAQIAGIPLFPELSGLSPDNKLTDFRSTQYQ